jgi:PHD/YefM family antitoxin component YafN of YafNO toxin-antitoxin module
MINIKPSAAIRKNYNEISELCKKSGRPVYLTKNGKGDLVVMDIEAFARRESMLLLREKLVAAEENRLIGKSGYSIDEVSSMMKAAVKEVLDEQRG